MLRYADATKRLIPTKRFATLRCTTRRSNDLRNAALLYFEASILRHLNAALTFEYIKML